MACGSAACSYALDLTHFSAPSPGSRGAPIRLGRWLQALLDMHERWRQRQALMELDDRMLADIGVSRDERRAEVEKPLWR